MHSSGMCTVCSSSHLSQGGYGSVHALIPVPLPRDQIPLDQAPPGDLLQGMLGYHLQGMLG